MGRRATVAAVATVALVSLFWRMAALNPPSLYLDDQWVAIVIRSFSWAQFFDLMPTVPVGFVALQRLFGLLSADPEWPLQVLPLLAGVAVVPAVAALAYRITHERSLAVLAAALIAIDPLLARYGVTVKQYATDALISTFLVWLSWPLLERWSLLRMVVVAVCGIVALTLSFPSVFVGTALLHLGIVSAWGRRSDDPTSVRSAAFVAAAYDVLIGMFYLAFLRGQGNAAMVDFWKQAFLPVTSVADAGSFLLIRGRYLLTGAFSNGMGMLTWLVVPGVVGLLLRSKTRLGGSFFVLFYAGLLAASALQIYPVGAGRTDVFSHPLTIVCVAAGLGPLVMLQRSGTLWSGLVWLAAAGLLVLFGAPSQYRAKGDDGALVRELERLVVEEDAVVIYPPSAFALAYYSDWQFNAMRWPEYAHGFAVEFSRPRTLVVPAHPGIDTNPSVVDGDLSAFLAESHRRLVLFTATEAKQSVHFHIRMVLERSGYRVDGSAENRPPHLLVFKPTEAKFPNPQEADDG